MSRTSVANPGSRAQNAGTPCASTIAASAGSAAASVATEDRNDRAVSIRARYRRRLSWSAMRGEHVFVSQARPGLILLALLLPL
jgi:hypothetical protein